MGGGVGRCPGVPPSDAAAGAAGVGEEGRRVEGRGREEVEGDMRAYHHPHGHDHELHHQQHQQHQHQQQQHSGGSSSSKRQQQQQYQRHYQ